MNYSNQYTNLTHEIDLNTWIVSDTHFGHDKVLQYEPSRLEAMQASGFDDHNEWLIHSWNATVGEYDLVLHLGDFAFKRQEAVIERLNGRIILLVGNHDVHSIQWLRNYQHNNPDRFVLIEGIEKQTNPQGVSGLMGEFGRKKVFFSHYPLVSEDPYTRGKAKATRDAMAHIFEKEQCDLCIHGHLHSNDGFTNKKREINVSIERIGFKPVRLGDLINAS
jgi:calcineurin-like phosphoesterase family protein